MTYVIADTCTRDGSCVKVCPVGCIVPGPKDDPRWPQFYIDPSVCIDCWACVPECPEKAIFPDIELPAEHAKSLEENARYFSEGPGYWAFDLEEQRVRST